MLPPSPSTPVQRHVFHGQPSIGGLPQDRADGDDAGILEPFLLYNFKLHVFSYALILARPASCDLGCPLPPFGKRGQGLSRIGGGTDSGTKALARPFSPFCTAITQTVFNGTWLSELNEIVPVTPWNPLVCSRA